MIDARRERKIMTTEHDRQDAHEQHVQRPRFATNTAHDTHEEVRAKLCMGMQGVGEGRSGTGMSLRDLAKLSVWDTNWVHLFDIVK